MSLWHWYVARDNELFIDMDRYAESIHHAGRRLQGAIDGKYLDVREVYAYPSQTNNHAHIIIVLGENHKTKDKMHYGEIQRYVWEMLFHGDIYRCASNIFRRVYSVGSPDILITRRILHRTPDFDCECQNKHSKLEVMKNCPAATALRGIARTMQFFGKPSKESYFKNFNLDKPGKVKP